MLISCYLSHKRNRPLSPGAHCDMHILPFLGGFRDCAWAVDLLGNSQVVLEKKGGEVLAPYRVAQVSGATPAFRSTSFLYMLFENREKRG